MNISKILQSTRIPSILLALLLQCAPVCRMVQAVPTLGSPMAYVFKFVVFAASMLGSVHAISGASAVLITSSTNAVGTNGTAFRYRITENSPSSDPGVWYNAIPLPPGLTINTNTGVISGTPTQTGVTLVRLTAGYEKERAIPTNMVLSIYGKPVVTAQPTNQAVNAGATASFSVGVTALPAPRYRWRFNGTTLPGRTNATLVLSNLVSTDAGNYTVVVSNFLGSVTSAVATLTIASNPDTPVIITTQPQSRTTMTGSNATFIVVASGTPPITFQWQKNGGAISGATNSTLTLGPLDVSQSGDYSVIVSNSVGLVTSEVATLNVVPPPTMTRFDAAADGFRLSFVREPGATYEIVYADALPPSNWTVLTNFPSVATPTPQTVTNMLGASTMRFFRIRLSIP